VRLAVSRFAPDGGHGDKKKHAIDALTRFFDRFLGLGAGGDA
jgi:type I restriction enzyme R subunit